MLSHTHTCIPTTHTPMGRLAEGQTDRQTYKQTDRRTDEQRVGHTDRHTQLQPHSIVAIAREIDFLNANALHMS